MAGQREYEVAELPANGLDAHATLIRDHLPHIRAVLDDEMTRALAVILPSADPDHSAWRRALAGDLARAYAPKRINVVAGPPSEQVRATLDFLRDAPGVTGHYVEAHD